MNVADFAARIKTAKPKTRPSVFEFPVMETCANCDSSGKVDGEDCAACEGAGTYAKSTQKVTFHFVPVKNIYRDQLANINDMLMKLPRQVDKELLDKAKEIESQDDATKDLIRSEVARVNSGYSKFVVEVLPVVSEILTHSFYGWDGMTAGKYEEIAGLVTGYNSDEPFDTPHTDEERAKVIEEIFPPMLNNPTHPFLGFVISSIQAATNEHSAKKKQNDQTL